MLYENMPDVELLALIFGKDIAEAIVEEFPDLSFVIVNSTEEELVKLKGIGPKTAKEIKAIAELFRRLYKINYTKEYRMSTPQEAADIFMADLRYMQQECLNVALLNVKLNVIKVLNVSKGTLNSSLIEPQMIFAPAIKYSASQIVMAHNHPSGDPRPSSLDIDLTKRIIDAGKILGISLQDHLIIGNGTYTSLKEKGLM